MVTGRKLSWREEQDLKRYEEIHPYDRFAVLKEEWGREWVDHISVLYWERQGLHRPFMSTHL